MNPNELSRHERRQFYNDGKYSVMPNGITKDNQENYNRKGGGSFNENTIRVPSLKRSKKVWINFYKLFPWLKGKKVFRGIKLKKV